VKTFTKCKDICRTENQCRFYLYHFESQECFVYDSDKLSCSVTFDRFDTDVKRCHDATITTNSDPEGSSTTPSQSFNDTVREVDLKTIQTTSGIRELDATTPGITEFEISSTTTIGIYGLDTTTTTAAIPGFDTNTTVYTDLNTTISEIPGINTSTTTTIAIPGIDTNTTTTTIAIPGIDTSTTTTGMPILDLSTRTTTTGSNDITTPWDGSSSWKPQLNMSE